MELPTEVWVLVIIFLVLLGFLGFMLEYYQLRREEKRKHNHPKVDREVSH